MKRLNNTKPETISALKAEMGRRKIKECFLVFYMGSQYARHIVALLGSLGFFAIICDPGKIQAADITRLKENGIDVKGIIGSGGPASVVNEPPPFDYGIFDLGIPVLGICLTAQMIAKHVGGSVVRQEKKEYGVHRMIISPDQKSPLFLGIIAEVIDVLQNHGDQIEQSSCLTTLGFSEHSPNAAFSGKGQYAYLFGLQFHPEVTHTPEGKNMFENFCVRICGAKERYPAEEVSKKLVQEIKETVGTKDVLALYSGGVDSLVTLHLLCAALPRTQIKALYIDGLGSDDDKDRARKRLPEGISFTVINARREFLKALKGKRTMHSKRKAVRKVYKRVAERYAKKIGVSFIAQGTLWTDLVESAKVKTNAARTGKQKLHHNVDLKFFLPEILPLENETKDTVRAIGTQMGISEEALGQHPFPGPGFVAYIEGEVTSKKLQLAAALYKLLHEELRNTSCEGTSLYDAVWQSGPFVLDSCHSATKGEDPYTGRNIVYFASDSVDGFTAVPAELPWTFHQRFVQRAVNEIDGIGSISYRMTGKPPSMILIG